MCATGLLPLGALRCESIISWYCNSGKEEPIHEQCKCATCSASIYTWETLGALCLNRCHKCWLTFVGTFQAFNFFMQFLQSAFVCLLEEQDIFLQRGHSSSIHLCLALACLWTVFLFTWAFWYTGGGKEPWVPGPAQDPNPAPAGQIPQRWKVAGRHNVNVSSNSVLLKTFNEEITAAYTFRSFIQTLPICMKVHTAQRNHHNLNEEHFTHF